jgi:hypothetical protein
VPARRASPPDPQTARAWAAEQGVEVSARGRLSRQVVEAYLAAAG